MEFIRYTLIADGSSDKALMNIIKWVLDNLFPEIPNKGTYGDFRMLQKPPRKDEVYKQIQCAVHYYPFDILFYHRDAESNSSVIIDERIAEIKGELDAEFNQKIVCVVPIKMMEAWLLIDEMAIKKAAGNKNYNNQVDLPPVNKLETLKEPKEILHELLKKVSGLKGRRLKNFNVHKAVHLVTEYTTDYELLRQLSAFNKFEEDLKIVVKSLMNNNK
ncbi:hypothetical protein [Flavobacterium sp. GSP14]|uniref:hypothetical protein n=1 Tax=Flavobacterium sp. GSP14 TaxID=3401734 RepID=UPI003AADFD90